MNRDLDRLRAVADYQFGYGVGEALFPDEVHIEYSKNTSKPRHVYLGDELLANYRPNDGLFTLTIAGAERIMDNAPGFNKTVTVTDNVLEFIEDGKNLFAKHVVKADEGLHPGEEVIILDESGKVAAVGKAILTRDEMFSFKTGIAVNVRRGRSRHR